MRPQNLLRFFLLLLCIWFLVTVLRRSGVIPSQSASTYALTSAGMCHMRMVPHDSAPGNWWRPHKKYVYADADTNYTELYSQGKAYITYNDPSNGGSHFDNNSYWIQPSRTPNVWSIRTRWTWLNLQFTSGDWELWYPC